MADAPWQIRLLGTLEARHGETVHSRFATSRVAALLARLTLFPQRTHSREELAGVLWPEADNDAGRLNLRVALASLRRQLEPPGCPAGSVLITDRSSIRLNPHACVTDAAQFEAALHRAARAADLPQKRDALHHALTFYAGELLPGFYDEWILEERERLQALSEDAEIQRRALPPPSHLLSPEAPSEKLIGFPGQFTRFFGRSSETARLTGLLADPAVRLVTLLGPGGAGKTRLALEAARRTAGAYDGPVCFVPLADIGDSALIPSAVATALRLSLSGDKSPLEQVVSHLSSGRSLLALDNMEHLGDGGAAATHALLEQIPHLTCLVTSRRTLNLEGEQEMLLTPLPIPTGPAQGPEHLATYSSVQLFVDRAQAIRPDFRVTTANADAVADVCRSLEGLPLALELAAARIQALTPAQMQQQLEARLDFLTSRRRDLPPRHRSLRAALEWSADLLSPEQTRFFARLSVFRGGWTLEAAAAVGGVSDPLALLEQLCEHSLIVAEESPPGMRFRMLESLREFGEEQLTPHEMEALACRHAAYFGDLAARMDSLWNSPQQSRALAVLDAEQDNLRAALSFCRSEAALGDGPRGETGLRLAAHLGNYWTLRGLLREGLDWLEGALAAAGSPAARAGALAASGWLAAGLGDPRRADAALTESISISRSLGDRAALATALRMRGVAGTWHDNYPQAAIDLEEALTLSRAVGDHLLTAVTLNSLGVLAYQGRGDLAGAQCLYEEALALFLRFEDNQRASYCLHNLGCLAHERGDYERADALLRRSLALADALGDLWQRAYCLRALGDVLMEQGNLPGAALLFEEGCALCRRLGDRMSEAGTALSLARVRRGQRDWAAASALGRSALLLYQAMDHAVGKTEAWTNLAETAAASEDWPKAAALLSAADTCRRTPAAGSESDRIGRLHHSARAHLRPAEFDAAWKRGQTLTCDEYGLR